MAVLEGDRCPTMGDMGVTYTIDAAARIVRLKLVGAVSVEEWTSTIRAVLRTSGYTPGFGFLVDRRDAEAPTAEYVERVVGFTIQNQDRLVGARWATVVSNRAAHEMARMGQQLADRACLPMPIQIFEDIDAAERWLRLLEPED